MRKGAIVVGAGIYGLSAALALARRGWGVTVLDRARPGAGASGGTVGALAPHAPAPWNALKAAEHARLLAAEGWWREIAAASGIDPGYARTGRAMPLPDPAARARAEHCAEAARAHWPTARWTIGTGGASAHWLAPGPHGAVHETLTARIVPRRALAALAGALDRHGGTIVCGAEVKRVESGGVRLVDGHRIAADAIVVATGAAAGALVPAAIGGVKGQAALLSAQVPEACPVIAAPGLWIVPHGDRLVGIGSTREPRWTHDAPDAALDAVLARARALCPWLDGATVLERWAGIRPRAPHPAPLVGAVAEGVWLAGGGYGTGWATGPEAGALVAGMIAGLNPALPAGFRTP